MISKGPKTNKVRPRSNFIRFRPFGNHIPPSPPLLLPPEQSGKNAEVPGARVSAWVWVDYPGPEGVYYYISLRTVIIDPTPGFA